MSIDKFEQLEQQKQNAILAAGVEEFSKKAYSDASTDAIVQACGISKGLLFHYFGSKREFYGYCLSHSLEKLTKPNAIPEGNFYEILFTVMNQKLELCVRYPAETHFVNMASRESAKDVAKEKSAIFTTYAARIHSASAVTMERAVATLSLKDPHPEKAKEGLLLYSNAIINTYLQKYQYAPDQFFNQIPQIQSEIKTLLDVMLHGITKEEML